jgi:hypothetical protein
VDDLYTTGPLTAPMRCDTWLSGTSPHHLAGVSHYAVTYKALCSQYDIIGLFRAAGL